MRIACFQGPEKPNTPQGNLELLGRMALAARGKGAEVLIVPELFLTGYAIGAPEVARLAEPLAGAALTVVAGIAKANGLAIILGFPELSEGAVYNAAAAFDAQGQLLVCYRKTHLFGDLDKGQFSESAAPPTLFEIGGFRVGLLICYDVEFPENTRALALLGADLVVVPTALMRPFDVVANILVPARAYENQVYMAYVDRCGTEADFEYCGLSCVVGPDGVDLARAGRGEELILADIDLSALRQSRQINTHMQDRRPALYRRLIQGEQDQ